MKLLVLFSIQFAPVACVQRFCREKSTILCEALVVVEVVDLGSRDKAVVAGNVLFRLQGAQ